MRKFLELLLVLLSCSANPRVQASGVPKSSRSNAISNNIKLVGIPAAVAALVPGKAFLDGPTFNEDVSMTGKTVVLTGGNSGLGKETAVKLASLGGNVIILCRNPAAATEAVEEIKRRSGSSSISALKMDLADLSSIESCVTELKKNLGGSGVDVVVNNAGVMAIPSREVTRDGFERQMGINHLGHFVFTSKLFENGLVGKGSSPTR
jgi:short chain dehydrogenase